jgi:hypothetical protein
MDSSERGKHRFPPMITIATTLLRLSSSNIIALLP